MDPRTCGKCFKDINNPIHTTDSDVPGAHAFQRIETINKQPTPAWVKLIPVFIIGSMVGIYWLWMTFAGG